MIANNKGGVGKTTLTFQVGCIIAASNPQMKILLLDTDTQGNLTNRVNGGKGKSMKYRRGPFQSAQYPNLYGLLCPLDASFTAENEAQDYDLIIIDTRPGTNPPKEAQVDALVVPFAEEDGARGVGVTRSWAELRGMKGPVVPVFVMLQKTNKGTLRKIRKEVSSSFLTIPESSSVHNNPSRPMRLATHRGADKMIAAYSAVAKAVLSQRGGRA